jgi:hypothetical protein
MNSKSPAYFAEAAARMMAALSDSTDPMNQPRALLVTLNRNGELQHQPVATDQSLIRLGTELEDHLSARPCSDEFLASLRDYCAGRLAALEEARRTRGFVTSSATSPKSWEIRHVPAFHPLKIGGSRG